MIGWLIPAENIIRAQLFLSRLSTQQSELNYQLRYFKSNWQNIIRIVLSEL